MIDDETWARLVELAEKQKLTQLLVRQRAVVSARLEGIDTVLQKRASSRFRASDLLDEYARNPYRVLPVLQALAFNCTSEMLAMMWLVVRGATVDRIRYEFVSRSASSLVIDVKVAAGTILEFASTEHWDLSVLRLAGISKTDGHPLVESFYALKA